MYSNLLKNTESTFIKNSEFIDGDNVDLYTKKIYDSILEKLNGTKNFCNDEKIKISAFFAKLEKIEVITIIIDKLLSKLHEITTEQDKKKLIIELTSRKKTIIEKYQKYLYKTLHKLQQKYNLTLN